MKLCIQWVESTGRSPHLHENLEARGSVNVWTWRALVQSRRTSDSDVILFSKMVDTLGSSRETWSQFVAITQIREMD